MLVSDEIQTFLRGCVEYSYSSTLLRDYNDANIMLLSRTHQHVYRCRSLMPDGLTKLSKNRQTLLSGIQLISKSVG